MSEYLALIDGAKIWTLLILIGLDWLLGVIIALFGHTFDWRKLAQFLDTTVLKMVAGYFLLGVFALAEPSAAPAILVTWIALTASLTASVVAKLGKLGVLIKPTGG